METNELIISRHNRHCLQCRSLATNVISLGEVADFGKINFQLKTKYNAKRKRK